MYTHTYREVADKVIHLSNNESIPYGFCVWAAGVGPTSLVLDLIGSVRQHGCLYAIITLLLLLP